jgi:hypothetical protein
MHMEMDEKIVLSLSGPFNSEQVYSPHFLWFRIISSKFQTWLGQAPNARGWEGASTTDHPKGKTIYFHQSTYPT